MRLWPDGEFHVQHFTRLAGMVQVYLYLGQSGSAWRILTETWPALSGSCYMRIEAIRIFMIHLRGRAAVARAIEKNSNHFLAIAARDALRLRRARAAWARPLALGLEASIATVYGDRDRALSMLSQAAVGLRSHQLHLFADAADRARAMVGRDAPAVQMIDQSMRQRGIVDPRSMAMLHVPVLCRRASDNGT